ncbi:MAG: hypothetical protein J6586_10270 [Snodgrassella sp.]|nr:hypothetical protein [Snodgrassella sp.]
MGFILYGVEIQLWGRTPQLNRSKLSLEDSYAKLFLQLKAFNLAHTTSKIMVPIWCQYGASTVW